MRPLLLVVLAVAGCATATPPSARPGSAVAVTSWPGSATLDVEIFDARDDSTPKSGVPVIIQSSRIRRPMHAMTDIEGRVRVEDLPGGIYDVQTEDGVRAVVHVPAHGSTQVKLRSHFEHVFVCWSEPKRPLDRSLLDDDAAARFLHEPRVIHRLP